MIQKVPLVYFYGVTPGRYMAVWPVYIIGDDPRALAFTVAVGEKESYGGIHAVREPTSDAERRYLTIEAKHRLHQAGFRHRVIQAYQAHCAVCRLRHEELLEAAHILPDSDPRGKPIVSNGLSLCKLHHAAFDRHLLGIRPEYVVELRRDILDEADGPMLRHGLQGFQGSRLFLPRSPVQRSNPDFLEERFGWFKKAG